MKTLAKAAELLVAAALLLVAHYMIYVEAGPVTTILVLFLSLRQFANHLQIERLRSDVDHLKEHVGKALENATEAADLIHGLAMNVDTLNDDRMRAADQAKGLMENINTLIRKLSEKQTDKV